MTRIDNHLAYTKTRHDCTAFPQPTVTTEIPVTVRFSNATGVPNIPDTNPNANPRGIAIRFTLRDGRYTDIVSISANAFPASTPEENSWDC